MPIWGHPLAGQLFQKDSPEPLCLLLGFAEKHVVINVPTKTGALTPETLIDAIQRELRQQTGGRSVTRQSARVGSGNFLKELDDLSDDIRLLAQALQLFFNTMAINSRAKIG